MKPAAQLRVVTDGYSGIAPGTVVTIVREDPRPDEGVTWYLVAHGGIRRWVDGFDVELIEETK